MRTNRQRIDMMHELAYKKKRKIEERMIKTLGAVSFGIFALLIGWIYIADGRMHSIADADFAGNSLLSADAGGYVLTAVISFIAAVAITIICIKINEKNKGKPDDIDDKNI
ncbi:MAG: hypothetical protein K6A45_02820 [Lachnospiraceae bacterium]|nr:hypothetical protein [Lachnospiraceae bacterium]